MKQITVIKLDKKELAKLRALPDKVRLYRLNDPMLVICPDRTGWTVPERGGWMPDSDAAYYHFTRIEPLAARQALGGEW